MFLKFVIFSIFSLLSSSKILLIYADNLGLNETETFYCNPQTRRPSKEWSYFQEGGSFPLPNASTNEDSEEDRIIKDNPLKDAVCSVKEIGNLMCELDGFVSDSGDLHNHKNIPEPPTQPDHNTHYVTTKDGYILALINVNSTLLRSKRKGVILIQHGLLCSWMDWIVLGEKSLPKRLSKEGYDIWIGNARGTTYSRNHTIYNVTQKEFWNFTWHEMGQYDIPAVVNYILEQTGEKAIFYAGHSMGCTMFFVAMAENPYLKDKIRAMFALSPAIYVQKMKSPMRFIGPYLYAKDAEMKFGNGTGELLDYRFHKMLMTASPGGYCANPAVKIMCQNVMFVIAGFDACQMDRDCVNKVVAVSPSTTSVKTVKHFLQLALSNKFQKYDYYPDIEKNREIYKRDSPTEYNLKNIKVPIYVYFGTNDWLVPSEDIERLCTELGLKYKSENCTKIDFDLWNHLDFVYGKDADEFIYKKIAMHMLKH